jgi:hypothetical protein
VPVLRVHTPDGRAASFSRSFRIGRTAPCEVCVEDPHVSRQHVAVSLDQGRWWLRDLQSANGVFVDGQRTATAWIDRTLTIGLGPDGPFLTLELDTAPRETREGRKAAGPGFAKGVHDLLTSSGSAGRRTRMFIEAFQGLQRRQRRYRWLVAAVAAVAIAAGGYALYLRHQVAKQVALAEQLFYDMKSLDVQIAGLEQSLGEADVQGREQVRQYLERRRQMETNYEEFLASLNVRGGKASEQERLILKVTRLLGECDLAAPPGYVGEVTRYIREWQSSPRFARGVRLAQEKGYTGRIVKEFQAQGLPPQFFYLALQESDFNPYASGPPTYMGIAKGMWQFIPDTARQYGLAVGPQYQHQRPDPLDDRHDWQKATRAAARYIKFIYSTDAQASGLLVMASYNWGEGRVIKLVRSLPANPRERNFWQLLEKHAARVPPETYGYVFRIVAAAVIGENPRLFGYPFDNPLASAPAQ